MSLNVSLVVSFLIAFAMLVSRSSASVTCTPEPAVDPMYPVSQLVVTSAGRKRIRTRIGEKVLQDGSRICPQEYPRGFSIRCESAESVWKAKFFVNDILVRTERNMPYYIAGNYNSYVKPWNQKEGEFTLRCTLGKKVELKANIIIGC